MVLDDVALGVQREKRTHPGYSIGPRVIGEWQFIYSSPKGKISLIELPNYFHDGIDLYEIYSLEGNLFEGVRRASKFEEAEQMAISYLTETQEGSPT